MTAKKQSPERIAHQAELARHNNDQRALMLLAHIQTVEAERATLDNTVQMYVGLVCKLEKELAESRAECERLRAELEQANLWPR